MALLSDLRKYMSDHPNESMADALDKMDIKWLETDTTTCPALAKGMERTANLKWVRPSFQPSSGRGIDDLLHADSVSLEFEVYLTTAKYWGWIAKGSPAEWAVELRKSLESCWKPASIPVPWRAWREVERYGHKFLEPVTSGGKAAK